MQDVREEQGVKKLRGEGKFTETVAVMAIMVVLSEMTTT